MPDMPGAGGRRVSGVQQAAANELNASAPQAEHPMAGKLSIGESKIDGSAVC